MWGMKKAIPGTGLFIYVGDLKVKRFAHSRYILRSMGPHFKPLQSKRMKYRWFYFSFFLVKKTERKYPIANIK